MKTLCCLILFNHFFIFVIHNFYVLEDDTWNGEGFWSSIDNIDNSDVMNVYVTGSESLCGSNWMLEDLNNKIENYYVINQNYSNDFSEFSYVSRMIKTSENVYISGQ